MSDDSVKTIWGIFSTREDADRAVEHLVQEHGIDRADIFVQAKDARNTSGTAPSGADVSRNEGEASPMDPALHGSIQVSADVGWNEVEKAERAFRNAGATNVLTR
ncbi:hypothetical protein [Mesorhizobium sp. 1B3]|uniref:hypothetical protein n=1 Tax=Mesorhizobium sp. 1B3 TaxID=3243599 RepID=UPI003D95C83F